MTRIIKNFKYGLAIMFICCFAVVNAEDTLKTDECAGKIFVNFDAQTVADIQKEASKCKYYKALDPETVAVFDICSIKEKEAKNKKTSLNSQDLKCCANLLINLAKKCREEIKKETKENLNNKQSGKDIAKALIGNDAKADTSSENKNNMTKKEIKALIDEKLVSVNTLVLVGAKSAGKVNIRNVFSESRDDHLADLTILSEGDNKYSEYNVLNIFTRIAVPAATMLGVALLILSGTMMILVTTNEALVDKAKKIFVGTLIGIAIILGSYQIITFIASIIN